MAQQSFRKEIEACAEIETRLTALREELKYHPNELVPDFIDSLILHIRREQEAYALGSFLRVEA